VFADQGAAIVAPQGFNDYLNMPIAQERLEERRVSLAPWVNEHTRLVAPDQSIATQTDFTLGGLDFTLSYLGAAHSEGDLTLLVKNDKVLYSGDVIFEGRVPFVGNADTKHWLTVLTGLQTTGLNVLVPGHGPANTEPTQSITLTRDYLAFLREHMGNAAEDFMPFSEAYEAVDWTPFANLPAFEEANRRNAYQVFLSIEAEMLGK
jgi:glyoxylase-like metal-dependent hydrolase (beta-lactamase superfamily II)